MNIKMIALGTVLSLTIAGMFITGITPLYSDDGEQQATEEQNVIDPAVESYLSRHSPESKIYLTVMLKPDPNIDQEIVEIRQKYDTQYYDQYYAMTNEIDSLLNRKYEQAIEKIQELPDTALRSHLWNNSLEVRTRVDNVEAIAAVPDVVKIYGNWVDFGVGDYSSIKNLYPANGTLGVGIQPLFSWVPLKDVTRYKLVLSRDAAMTQIIKEVEVPTAKYVYRGTIEYGTNYFWQVMAIEPSPSEWSGTWSFQTEAAPPTPPTEVQSKSILLSPALTAVIVVTLAASAGLVTWFILARQRRIKRKSG